MCKYEGCNGCDVNNCPGCAKCRCYDNARNRDRYNNDPEYRKRASDNRAIRRANPEYRRREYDRDNASARKSYKRVGDMKIYMYPDGSILYMRSMSEVYFASFLDDENLTWKYESVTFPTPYGRYSPDFYVIPWGAYVEVKARRWLEKDPEQQVKREYLRKQGIKIYLVDSVMIDNEFRRDQEC